MTKTLLNDTITSISSSATDNNTKTEITLTKGNDTTLTTNFGIHANMIDSGEISTDRLPTASTSAAGIVKLDNNITSNSTADDAATAKSVYDIASDSVKLSGDQTISGVKTFENRIILQNEVDIQGTLTFDGEETPFATLEGDQTLQGVKRFNDNVIIPNLYTKHVNASLSGPNIAAGSDHSLAIDEAGQIYAWGSNYSGQVGNGIGTIEELPINISGEGDLAGSSARVVAISAGSDHSLAIDEAGQIYAWGSNHFGQIGIGNRGVNSTEGHPVNISREGDLSGSSGRIVAISAGYWHSLAIDDAGQIYAWGFGNNGLLGTGENVNEYQPVKISGNGDLPSRGKIVCIAGGKWHSLAIDDAGQIYAWGNNYQDNPDNISGPVNISGEGDLPSKGRILAISAGISHSLAIDDAGQIYAWGYQENGRLGNGNTTTSFHNTPINISNKGDIASRNIVAISAGEKHSMAIDYTGRIYTWGNGDDFRLATENNNDRATPVYGNMYWTSTSIVAISAGGEYSMAIDHNGQIFTWGNGGQGQLGTNSTQTELNPTNISGNGDLPNYMGKYIASIEFKDDTVFDKDVTIKGGLMGSENIIEIKSIVAGTQHSLAIDSAGGIYAWGRGDYGKLGTGNTNNQITPVKISGNGDLGSSSIIAISASWSHSLAIDAAGDIYAWGSGTYGKLGRGNTNDQTSPVKISGNGDLPYGVENIVTIKDGLRVNGNISKGSGTFNIPHPLESKHDTHRLVHSFVEAPQADLIYSGMVTLGESGHAVVNIDEVSGMTPGTFKRLCRDVRYTTQNEGGFTAVRSSFQEDTSTLIIQAQSTDCRDLIFWQVLGERKDETIMRSSITDDRGRLIVEPLIKDDMRKQKNT